MSARAALPDGSTSMLPRSFAGTRLARDGSWARALRTRTPRSGTERASRSALCENRVAWALWAARRNPARKGSELTIVRVVPTRSGRIAMRSRFWATTSSVIRSATNPDTRGSPRLRAARAANARASKMTRSA